MNKIEIDTFLIISRDKITKNLFKNFNRKNILVIEETTPKILKVLKVLKKNRISIFCLLLLLKAEIERKNYKLSIKTEKISKNEQLVELYNLYKPSKIFLFRSGLIINTEKYLDNVQIRNIHCAKLPEYPGLGSIFKAIKNCDYKQYATLHEVVKKIDSGKIIDVQNYSLNKNLSYRTNEDIAYKAGFKLLMRHL